MSMRRITASLAAIAAAVVLPIAVAAPAHAGVSPAIITVGLDASGTKCVASASSITGNPGSRFTVHNVDCQRQIVGYVRILSSPGTILESGVRLDGNSSTTLTLGRSSGTLSVFFAEGGNVNIAVTITTDPVAEPQAHDEFQQVGVPASGDCADVPVTVGHYPGYPIGGWSKSWAQWINDGKGGPVCTREVEERPDGTVVLVG